MAENKLADMSTEFAVKILNLTDGIKGHYSLSNQLERSGTSIGANIREAKYAHSKADFVAKLQISLKECYETEYWIEIAQKANIISEEKIVEIVKEKFNLTPRGIIEYLGLREPIYAKTTNYGHFGDKDLPWEKVIKL